MYSLTVSLYFYLYVEGLVISGGGWGTSGKPEGGNVPATSMDQTSAHPWNDHDQDALLWMKQKLSTLWGLYSLQFCVHKLISYNEYGWNGAKFMSRFVEDLYSNNVLKVSDMITRNYVFLTCLSHNPTFNVNISYRSPKHSADYVCNAKRLVYNLQKDIKF